MHVVVFECDDFLVACYVLLTGPKANQNPSFTIWCSYWSTSSSQSCHFAHIPGTITWPPYMISNSESQMSLLRFFLRGGRSVQRLSLSCRSITCLSRLATCKSWYFAQPHPIIVNYFIHNCHHCLHLKFDDKFSWYDGNCNNWQMLK